VLKDVPSVLALVKEETVRPLLHLDVEEVVERVDALNDKLLLESCSGMLEKLLKVYQDQERGEIVVPSSWRLHQVVEELVEPSHKLRVGGVNEVDKLRAVDRLSEGVVEEGVLDVELVHESAQLKWWQA
jgi:hypothetical protein